MDAIFSLDNFVVLFQTGFLINAAYMAIRMKLGSPVTEYVRLERDVRVRLKPLTNDDIKPAKARLTKDMRQSEIILRVFLKLSSLSQYIALFISFSLLLVSAFAQVSFSSTEIIVLLALVYIPLPLSVATFNAASFLYLGQLERDLMSIALAANLEKDIKTANRGAERTVRIKNTIEHLESALGGRR